MGYLNPNDSACASHPVMLMDRSLRAAFVAAAISVCQRLSFSAFPFKLLNLSISTPYA
jgi:hypothetical protein